MMRAVLDTNLIVSGLLWRGVPGKIVLYMLDRRFSPLMTPETISELEDVLQREIFAERLAVYGFTANDIVGRYLQLAIGVEAAEIPVDAVRDPKDRAFLACAVGGQADVIVTGDRDLLVLGQYAGIPIVTPAIFLEMLETKPEA